MSVFIALFLFLAGIGVGGTGVYLDSIPIGLFGLILEASFVGFTLAQDA